MITAARTQLAAELAALDVPVHQAWPDRITPPCVLLTPPQSGSYVTGGQTFRDYEVFLDAVVLAERGSFDVVLPALETLLAALLHLTEDWALQGIDPPSVTTVGSVDYLGTVVHLSRQIQST
jgi:hypothetical protein